MRLMGLPMRPSAMEELQAASAVGQGKLYRHYDELLQDRGVKSAQVLLTFFDMSARTHYLNARHTLRKLLDWRVVPVINENDTTTTDEISFGDNDFLAAQVAILIGADRLVLLTDIGGLYSADPRTDPSAELIEEVSDIETLAAFDIGVSTSPLGSGGMRSKVVAAEMATAAGIPVTIANGVERDGRRPGARGRAGGHPLRAPARPGVELQAVAALRQAGARARDRRRRRRAGAARARHQPAAGRASSRWRATSRPATRSRCAAAAGRLARGSSATRRASCAGSRD